MAAPEKSTSPEELMSEALTIEPGSLRWEPAPLLPGDTAWDRSRQTVPVELPALPSVQPGELWLVEFPPTELRLSPLGHRARTSSSVCGLVTPSTATVPLRNLGKTITLPATSGVLEFGLGVCAKAGPAAPRAAASNTAKPARFIMTLILVLPGL